MGRVAPQRGGPACGPSRIPRHHQSALARAGASELPRRAGTVVDRRGRTDRSTRSCRGTGHRRAPGAEHAAPVWDHPRARQHHGRLGRRRARGGQEGRPRHLAASHPNNPLRLAYRGTPAYAPHPRWRVTGRFVPFDQPRPTTVGAAVQGLEHVYHAVGAITFELDGHELSLTRSPGTSREDSWRCSPTRQRERPRTATCAHCPWTHPRATVR